MDTSKFYDNKIEYSRYIESLRRQVDALISQNAILLGELNRLKDQMPSENVDVDSDSYLENYEVPSGHFLALRTSIRHPVTKKVVSEHDMKFEWPEEPGVWVTEPSYDETAACGKGLHGLKWGLGHLAYLANKGDEVVWQVVCVPEDLSVTLRDKVKFGKCTMVLSTSSKQEAFAFINKHAPKDLTPELSEADSFRISGYTDLNKDYDSDEFLELPLGPLSNVYTSKLKSGNHAPAIDIDVPAEFIPSSTEGHGHLKFDVEMTWEEYKKLLSVMVEVRLIEEGYYRASLARGATFLRLPWIKKEDFFS